MPTVEEMMGTALMTQERLVIDMSEDIALLQPSAAPLTALLAKLRKTRTVTNPRFDWMEDDLLPWTDAVNNAAGYAAADDTIAVDNVGYFAIGDIVHVPRTGENMRVVGKDAEDGTITVVRGWGSTAAALQDDDVLLILGPAMAENSLSRKPLIQNPVPKYNYTQIFKHTVGVSRTLMQTRTYGPKELARQHKLKGIEHKVAIERAFWFGTRNISYAEDGQAIRTTGGVLQWLSDNVYNLQSAEATEEEFNFWLEQVFQYGSKQKVFFCSPRWATQFALWGLDKLHVRPDDAGLGLEVKDYKSPHGRLTIIEHPLFTGPYGDMGVALDLDLIQRCPLEGSDTQILTNRQESDRDGRKDEIITEVGIEVRLPKAHGIIRGLSLS